MYLMSNYLSSTCMYTTLLKVDAGTVESMAQTADMSIAEFAAQTRRALTGQSTGQDNFVYQVKIHGNHLQVGFILCLQ